MNLSQFDDAAKSRILFGWSVKKIECIFFLIRSLCLHQENCKRALTSNHVILPLSSLAKYRASDHVCMITFYSALKYFLRVIKAYV